MAAVEDRIRFGAAMQPRLSTWRGASDRQYGVAIFPRAECEPDDLAPGVVILVRRDGIGHSAGIARPVRVAVCDDVEAAAALLVGLPAAVSELHAHRSAPDAAARAEAAADLQP